MYEGGRGCCCVLGKCFNYDAFRFEKVCGLCTKVLTDMLKNCKMCIFCDAARCTSLLQELILFIKMSQMTQFINNSHSLFPSHASLRKAQKVFFKIPLFHCVSTSRIGRHNYWQNIEQGYSKIACQTTRKKERNLYDPAI